MYFVYIIECVDGSLYTGIATDPKERFLKHKSGDGAKYTIAHPPLKLVYTEKLKDRSLALKREMEIKKLSRGKKLDLIKRKSPLSRGDSLV